MRDTNQIHKTVKSRAGYVFKMGDTAISWKSRKQTVVATSTAHAVLIALYEGTREATWLQRLAHFVEKSAGLETDRQIILLCKYEDEKACIAPIQKGFMRTDANM